MRIKFYFLLLLVFNSLVLDAQNTALLDSIILQNKYIILRQEGKFSGEGMDYILENCVDAQFVGLAENHNTKEIPIFTTFLFEQLHLNDHFNYLALEQDAVMMNLISKKQVDVYTMATKYHNGFTFISDQELELIAQAKKISKTKNSIWGCDQSFGASHAVAYISEALKNKGKANAKIDSIRNKIEKLEKTRDLEEYHYMADTLKRKDLTTIQEELLKTTGDSLQFYIHSLLISDSIYSQIMRRKYYQSRSMRENYIRTRFLEEYNKALKVDSVPKVLLKFGHYHLMDGLNSGSYSTNIGDLVRNLAQFNNKKALIINTQIYRNDHSDWDYLEDSYPMFTKYADINSWTLFDLRPLRSYQANGLLDGQIDAKFIQNWEDLIFKFDMILIVGNGGDGTWNKTGVKY